MMGCARCSFTTLPSWSVKLPAITTFSLFHINHARFQFLNDRKIDENRVLLVLLEARRTPTADDVMFALRDRAENQPPDDDDIIINMAHGLLCTSVTIDSNLAIPNTQQNRTPTSWRWRPVFNEVTIFSSFPLQRSLRSALTLKASLHKLIFI